MPGIICAIRGGPASQPTIMKGIQLAKKENVPLYFLYVINLEFLARTEVGRTGLAYDQLEQLGEFILLAAQENAKAQGIKAEGVIRHGTVREELINLVSEKEVNYVVLGMPAGIEENDLFAGDSFKEFVKFIEIESGAKVILAEGQEDEGDPAQ